MTNTNWVRTPVSPLLLANLVESTMHTLSKRSLLFMFSFDLPKIGRGYRACKCYIESPTRFSLEIPRVVGGAKLPLTAVTVVTDGKLMGQKPEDGKLKLSPYTKQRHLSPNPLHDWLYNGVGDMMQGFCSSAKPLTALVKAALAPGSGWETHTETRLANVFGQKQVYDRIVVSRKKGDQFYEIAINDHYKLPTSMSNTVHLGKQTYTSDMTQSQWAEIKGSLNPKMFNPRLLK